VAGLESLNGQVNKEKYTLLSSICGEIVDEEGREVLACEGAANMSDTDAQKWYRQAFEDRHSDLFSPIKFQSLDVYTQNLVSAKCTCIAQADDDWRSVGQNLTCCPLEVSRRYEMGEFKPTELELEREGSFTVCAALEDNDGNPIALKPAADHWGDDSSEQWAALPQWARAKNQSCHRPDYFNLIDEGGDLDSMCYICSCQHRDRWTGVAPREDHKATQCQPWDAEVFWSYAIILVSVVIVVLVNQILKHVIISIVAFEGVSLSGTIYLHASCGCNLCLILKEALMRRNIMLATKMHQLH
jgi:hypothetical protein